MVEIRLDPIAALSVAEFINEGLKGHCSDDVAEVVIRAGDPSGGPFSEAEVKIIIHATVGQGSD